MKRLKSKTKGGLGCYESFRKKHACTFEIKMHAVGTNKKNTIKNYIALLEYAGRAIQSMKDELR